MGTKDVDSQLDEKRLREFTKALLDDVRALEVMLRTDLIESGKRRIGAEQEMFLIDRALRPASRSGEILKRIDDPRFVTELAQFNLEANLSPQDLSGDCFTRMANELSELMGIVRKAAAECDTRVLLCGILPTLHLGDLQLKNMTPNPRYAALNQAISALRGGDFKCHIKGVDELELTTDNVMLEAANTSFQVHLQVGPREFASLYNLAQAVAGPILASAVNSPVLLGKRLWKESRVAVFQHSIDARSKGQQVRGHRPRVDFGTNWIRDSVLEIFHEDIARFRIVLGAEVGENALEVLARGEVPRLDALRMHNGTVYRWNRPCYGIGGGVAHLRIEARQFPAGPSLADEIANAAFFIGLMCSLGKEYGDITKIMEFDDAKANFFSAARYGLESQFLWPGHSALPAPRLILEHLLPLARAGLKSEGVDEADIDRYLGIIQDRVEAGKTGARWALESIATMGRTGSIDQRCRAVAAATLAHQETGAPGHTWPPASLSDAADWHNSYRTVSQCMSTDLLTVRPWDLVDLAASLMDWERIRHVPVENDDGRLVGVISHRSLLRLVAQGGSNPQQTLTVDSIMKRDPVTASPDTLTLDAIKIMRDNRVGCLPVVNNGKLVGIITERDFINVAAGLLEQRLKED